MQRAEQRCHNQPEQLSGSVALDFALTARSLRLGSTTLSLCKEPPQGVKAWDFSSEGAALVHSPLSDRAEGGGLGAKKHFGAGALLGGPATIPATVATIGGDFRAEGWA